MNKDFLKRMEEYLQDEYQSFLESYNKVPKRAIRVNISDINKLIMPLEKMPYGDNCYYLNDDVKYGNSVFHHLGAYYIQEPSAMVPVSSIDIKSDWRVLDLCASPGGKSSQLAAKLKDGFLLSNEIEYKRAKILFSNIERQGFNNVLITNSDAEGLALNFQGFFDLILVDSPCSGEGMFRKDEVAVNMWNKEMPHLCALRDQEILTEAIKMLKKDGILIYSTCTFSKEENEDMVSFLHEKGLDSIDVKDEIKKVTKEGFIPKTYRFYPHIADGEGQFVAVLKNNNETEEYYKKGKRMNFSDRKIVMDFINENIGDLKLNLIKVKNEIHHLVFDCDLREINVISHGVILGEIVKNRFVPHHQFFKVFGALFKNRVTLEENDPLVLRYLRGEEINYETNKGYGVIMISEMVLGGYKASNGVLKNLYPKGLRNY